MQRLTIQQNLDNCDFIVKKNDLEYCLMDCLGKDRVFLHTQRKYLLTVEEQFKFNQYTDKLKKSILNLLIKELHPMIYFFLMLY